MNAKLNAQLSFTIEATVDTFDIAVVPVLASPAFAEQCRSLTRDKDIVAAVTVRAEQLRATWEPSIDPVAWAHALARDVVIERHRTRREFESQVIPLRANLYGKAMRLTRDPSDADDLVQDTMTRAWRFWASYQQGSDLKAWLFTVLRNTFINGYHRRGRKKAGMVQVVAAVQTYGPAVAFAKSDRAERGPSEARLDDITASARLSEALVCLSEDYRTAVTMRDIDGLAYREIANTLDWPLGTVMSRIHRGRKLLREMLDEPDHARGDEWAQVCCRGASYADTAKGAAAFRERLTSQGFTVVEVARGHMWIRLHASRLVGS
jgi:RNA polymerase sigma-70 factor (ECF subfamily)